MATAPQHTVNLTAERCDPLLIKQAVALCQHAGAHFDHDGSDSMKDVVSGGNGHR
jgi:hypothetical protein